LTNQGYNVSILVASGKRDSLVPFARKVSFGEIARTFRASKVFCMLEAYLDESFNGRTMCVGGFLAHERVWRKIEAKWKERIAYENRKSAKIGCPPISRYHATDCANLKREFAPENGWDVPRQIKLTKRWIEIIQQQKPAGIVMGGGASGFLKHFTSDTERWREGLYYFSIIMCLYHVADLMEGTYPNEKVTVFYDRGKFSGMADLAYRSLMDDSRNAHVAKYFSSMAPVGWEDFIGLQLADFMAYEGFRRIDTSIWGFRGMVITVPG
jgi:hypothetical protein